MCSAVNLACKATEAASQAAAFSASNCEHLGHVQARGMAAAGAAGAAIATSEAAAPCMPVVTRGPSTSSCCCAAAASIGNAALLLRPSSDAASLPRSSARRCSTARAAAARRSSSSAGVPLCRFFMWSLFDLADLLILDNRDTWSLAVVASRLPAAAQAPGSRSSAASVSPSSDAATRPSKGFWSALLPCLCAITSGDCIAAFTACASSAHSPCVSAARGKAGPGSRCPSSTVRAACTSSAAVGGGVATATASSAAAAACSSGRFTCRWPAVYGCPSAVPAPLPLQIACDRGSYTCMRHSSP